MAVENELQEEVDAVDAVSVTQRTQRTPKRRKTDGQPKLPRRKPPKKNPNMSRKGEPKNSAHKIALAKKQAEALQYREMGYSYEQIAAQMGTSAQVAWNWVDAALVRTLQEPADEVRKLELKRLDAMQAAIYGNALKGDLMALAAMLNIMNRRTRYVGLDAPVKSESKTELSSTDGVMVIGATMSPEEWAVTAKAQQAAMTSEQG